ncbi:Transcription factor Pcc1 [Musa troglodytarum]|uniref:Transcription factor Pcc1 n=1 Tax=Musa troglodytarum TaxID=320322 RepID=A0A9E7EPQ4_9LILI|nr:Transcription factor Pcc1 [Musa troglodytarum]
MDPMVCDTGANADFGSLSSSGWEFRCSDFEVDYGSKEHANIIYAALAVDKELQPDKVKRQMSILDGKTFSAL